MNFLAHAHLSFHYPGIMLGNLISDFVKGRKKWDYPTDIQMGITLHRDIDRFTDHHPATLRAKELFRPHYRLYSGAFIDVVYDHFLATDSNEFSEESLLEFSHQVYDTISRHTPWLPEKFAAMFPYMKNQNWLYHYRSVGGIEKSFGGLVRRALHLTESHPASRVFHVHYRQLEEEYHLFWADVKPYAQQKLQELLKTGDNRV